MKRRIRAALRRGWRGAHHLGVLGRRLQHPADLLLVIEAICLQRRIPAWLALPLPLMMRVITPPVGPRLPAAELERRTRLIDATVHLYRVVPLGFCLRRSLVRYVFLHRAGLPAEIVFGVRPEEVPSASLIGHAWLEVEGVPWMEAPENVEGYTVMYRYPEQPQRQPRLERTTLRPRRG